MHVVGTDYIRTLVEQEFFEAKVVFNASGAIFFPASQEHRDQKIAGVSYEDDHRGNALAGMVRQGEVEIRFHGGFSDQQVATILADLTRQPDLALIANWKFTYQGRILQPDRT